MRKSIVRSVLVAAVLATGSVTASAQNAPQPTTSPAFAEQFTAALNAQKAKRWAEVSAKANEVLASSKTKKPDDIYSAHYFLLEAAKAQNNVPLMIQSLEGILASGFALGPAQNLYRKALLSAYFQQKNYPQAIKHGTDVIKAGGADDDVYTVVGQAYYQQKNYGDAVKLFSGLVESDEKAGRKPDRNKLVLLQSSYDKAGNAAAAQATLEKLVRYYPDPKTWLALLYDVKRDAREPRQKLQLYRLMESTGNLNLGPDFTAYSDSAMGLGLYAEAARVIQAAQKAKVYSSPEELARSERYLKSNLERADQARAELGKVQTEAKAAPTGNELVALGMQQLSFEQFPQAVESLKAGIAKGGLKNAADAQLTLGVAQVKAGHKADAGKTFRAIETDDETTERIAKFWALHAG